MSESGYMSLRIKFNIILIICLIALTAVLQHLHQQQTNWQQDQQLMQKGQDFHQLSQNIRHYTTEEIEPLLTQLDQGFLPQTVGSYAATQVITTKKSGAHSQHLVALLNAHLPRYQANAWQRELINELKQSPETPQITAHLRDANGPFYVLAHPIKNNNAVVGAQIIKIQTEASQQAVNKANAQFSWQLILAMLLVWLTINVLMHFLLFSPLQTTAEQVQKISLGTHDIQTLDTINSAELNQITQAFNRMQSSLQTAMNQLH